MQTNLFSMRKESRLFISLLRIGAAFFTNVSAGFLFAIYISPNMFLLTNNILLCIVCLYLGVYLDAHLSDYE